MGFKLMMMRPGDPNEPLPVDDWAERLRAAISDIEVSVCSSEGEAMEVIGEADAAFGDIGPELFRRGTHLRWVACPQAGPRAGYYHDALVASDVVNGPGVRRYLSFPVSFMIFVSAELHLSRHCPCRG